MSRRAVSVLLPLLAVALGGCLSTDVSSLTNEPEVTVAIGEDNRTVLFDASDYLNFKKGLRFFWDFEGTGDYVEDDPVVVYRYPQAGVYFCRLKVVGWFDSAGGSGTGGYPGDLGTGGGSSSDSSSLAFRALKVDLLQRNYPVIVLQVFDSLRDEINPDRLRAYFPIIFDASGSYSPEGSQLWFRWEIVYVEQEDGTWVPKPYPWQCTDPSSCPQEPQFLRYQGPTFHLQHGLPGPTCCPAPQEYWVYRVRLWVTDTENRTSFRELYIKVYPC